MFSGNDISGNDRVNGLQKVNFFIASAISFQHGKIHIMRFICHDESLLRDVNAFAVTNWSVQKCKYYVMKWCGMDRASVLCTLQKAFRNNLLAQ